MYVPFLEDVHFRLVGKYFCYRRYSDDQIRILTISGKQMGTERSINLKPLMRNVESRLYVMFRSVPPKSFLTIKSMIRGEKSEYY